MNPRIELAAQLADYRSWNTLEEGYRAKMADFLASEEDCFLRSHLARHFTASALILDRAGGHVLLLHHRKLDRWLQPGGHADGDPDLLGVALKEVEEETGLKQVRPLWREPFDLDIHVIPARKEVPEHDHYDVRYLLEGDRNEELVQNWESKGFQWLSLEEAGKWAEGESISRMLDKVRDAWKPDGPRPQLL